MERTIGTISGGVLGLAISLLGHGFGQDSDMVFTGARLPSHLIDIARQHSAGFAACEHDDSMSYADCLVYHKPSHSDTQ